MQRLHTAIKAPTGATLSCRGWHQEAAEDPENLIVYGGTGKAARNWDCYHALVRCLKELKDDESLLVQSGQPVGVFTAKRRG